MGRLIDRRTLLLGGLASLAAACAKAVKRASGGPGSPASSATTSSSSTAASPSPSPTPVPAALRIPDRVLKEDAPVLNGDWKGTWKSSDGSTGPFELAVAIDPGGRTARLTVSLGPGFYGPGSAPVNETLDFDLDDYAYMKPPYHGTSMVAGTWTLTGLGYGFVQLDTTGIPGHPEIVTFHTKGYVFGPSVLPDGGLPFSYILTRTDGKVIKGDTVLRTG